MERVIFIELAGAPGSGKTTLAPTVLEACAAAGLRAYTVEEAARVFARRTLLGRVTGLLPAKLAQRGLWALYYLSSGIAVLGFVRLAPELARYVLRTQGARPNAADVKDRRVVYWYFRTAGTYRFLRARGRPGEAVVVDEGFVHRAVQLHASSVETPEPDQIARYVDLLPDFDLLVVVEAPEVVCRERVHGRGPWTRLSHRRADEIDRFVTNAHRAIQLASDAARRQARPMISVGNAGDLGAARADLLSRLEAPLSERTGAGDRPRRPRAVLPSPSRISRTFAARVSPPSIDAEVCEAVLEQYGLTAVRAPENVVFGGRNANVVVHTSAGKKVLRRHRVTAHAPALRYEHSVLRELERRRFPAVRVATTCSGGTIAAHGGDLYALFEFSSGRSLASCLMSQLNRLRVLEAAGRSLARLHQELAEFAPEGQHHLGFDHATGSATQDLGWHLETVSALASRDPGACGAASEHQRALRDQHRDLAARLVTLHEKLQGAWLPQVIIHGDYGIHNLLFRPDGAAVVHDFELARREWRLIDLVIVMSRMPASAGKEAGDARSCAFLEGYRREAHVPAAEWRHMPEVWEFYWLTGAVRSWHNYFLHGDEQRLKAARYRIGQADRMHGKSGAL